MSAGPPRCATLRDSDKSQACDLIYLLREEGIYEDDRCHNIFIVYIYDICILLIQLDCCLIEVFKANWIEFIVCIKD